MKFDEGHWRLLPGVEAIYPITVVDVRTESDALVVSGYDHSINGRWSYLHGSLVTARFTSPMPDVIRVQIAHFKGRKERLPAFDLNYARASSSMSTGCDEKRAWLDAGRLCVRASRGGRMAVRLSP